jgi:hypothetical protein
MISSTAIEAHVNSAFEAWELLNSAGWACNDPFQAHDWTIKPPYGLCEGDWLFTAGRGFETLIIRFGEVQELHYECNGCRYSSSEPLGSSYLKDFLKDHI